MTTRQESALAVMAERRELHGPPMYFTPDWERAARSVAAIAALEPEVVATGHGEPLMGSAMRADLADLARDFHHRAVPRRGRYVAHPAETDGNGIVSLPPDSTELLPALLLGGEAAEFVRQFLGEDVAES